MFTLQKLDTIFSTLTTCSRFCVAYSGGLDSHVLLHAMATLHKTKPFESLRAIHINHGLNPNADQWEKHCEQVCKALGIPFISKKVTIDIKPGDSIEALARQKRYAVFRELIEPHENIVTAHTQNDQAETFLLQLLRGAGPKGLSAMPMKKLLGLGYLLRPLLNFRRDELARYAEQNRLKWIEDDTNVELRFNRNYLRHHIFPVLQQRWPEAFVTISRSAIHCAETAALLDELADLDLQTIRHDNQLSIESLISLSDARQRNVLRRWIVQQGYRVPNTKHMSQIQRDVVKAKMGANPVFSWDEAEIRRYQGRLYLSLQLPKRDTNLVIQWNFEKPLTLPNDGGTLTAVKKRGEGISMTVDARKITVCFRRGGERCRPSGRKETHSLKKLMQEWKIPSWQRDHVPLIYYEEKLIAVVGYCICEGFAAADQDFGWTIVFTSDTSLN